MKTALILLMALSFTISSQVSQQWMADYNGPTNFTDSARNVIVDNAGNVYVAGSSRGVNAQDYTVLKYNSAGALLWEARYDGPAHGNDDAQWMITDDSGNIYVTGSSRSVTGFDDYATVKYNSEGQLQWDARYNGTANNSDKALKVVVDISRNVYVTGWSNGSGSLLDYTTIKYNSTGTEEWVSRYNGPGNDWDVPTGIVVDNSGNVYVTGSSQTTSAIGSQDYLTIKYNSNGAEEWIARHDGAANYSDFATSIAIDNSGSIYVTGSCYSTESLNDYVTIKYNSAGQQQWVASYNGTGNLSDLAKMVILDNNGNIYVTGSSPGAGTSIDYTTVKYNSAGSQEWSARYNGAANSIDEPSAVTTDNNGNVYVTGKERINGAIYDYATVKYNFAGQQQWAAKFNGSSNLNDGATSVKVDNTGNVYVTGNSVNSFNSDFVTIKYNQGNFTPVNGNSNTAPESFSLWQNYPNPFNPATKIKFAITREGNVKLTVYDVNGRKVEELVNGSFSSGTYQADWNASRYSSGVYFYTIVTNDFTETKRMLLVK
ncbi:MAG: SBBP repeat-containing protein [Ignavibacteria bacterium]